VSDPIRFIRFAKGMSQSLCVALMLLTCGTLSAQNEEHRIRNIVLVRGAWADGSGWKGVYDILVKDGYNVSIVQEPETSFKDDVAATKRALALQDGPCILVGHSYGGAVITEAGTDSSVAGLVYVAAHMPDAGENKADDGRRFPSDLSKSVAIRKTADGFTYLDPAQFHEYSAADLSAEQAVLMARSQVLNFADNFKAVITGCVEKRTKLDGGSRGGQNHQPRPRTLVRHASQQPQGRICGRQQLGLRLQAERGCRCDRRGCSARSLERFVRCRWVRERRPGTLQTVIGMISVRDAPLPEFPSSGGFMPLWVIGQIVSGGR
jgi:pimeloyl-ACP methyl ester carboxylesterase